MVAGEGAELVDLDGHRYVDFVGEYSAGLFGHSEEAIKSAVRRALDGGVVMGAPTAHERELAELLCTRFPGIDQVRFCNSGTEANIWALTTARLLTGRKKIIVFRGAYHGGVIKFPHGHSALNIPFDFVLADYNDTEGTEALIGEVGGELAAVIVEPILGAGGNIPGDRAFMEMLRRATREVGALLIFDEVKTSRIGPAGHPGHARHQSRPDHAGQIHRRGAAHRCVWRQRRNHGAFQSEASGSLEPRGHLQQRRLLDGRRLCRHG